LEKAVVLFAVMSFDLFHLGDEILLASPVSLAIVACNVVVECQSIRPHFFRPQLFRPQNFGWSGAGMVKKSCHTGHNFSGPQKEVTDGFGETIPPEGRIQNDG
jgi:hypothetical protein